MDQVAKQVTVILQTVLSAMQEARVVTDANRDSKYQMVHVSAQPAQSQTVNFATEHSAQAVSQGTQDLLTNLSAIQYVLTLSGQIVSVLKFVVPAQVHITLTVQENVSSIVPT